MRQSRAKRSEATCIYCQSTKPVGEFNKEHVIPDSFGRFNGALTLVHTVCKNCNTFFNGELDRPLARESFEGLRRYSRVKPVEEVVRFQPGRGIILRHPGPGEYEGALLKAVPGPRGIAIDQLNQVMFVDPETGVGEPYTEQELRAPNFRDKAKRFVGWPIQILSDGDETFERLLSLMKGLGFSVESGAPMDPPGREGEPITVKVAVIVAEKQMRAVAKIGFNYLARIGGAELALRPEFNDVRAFIRYGVDPPRPLVTPDTSDFFESPDGSKIAGRLEGHFLFLVTEQEPPNILTRVSLFNLMSYQIVLTDRNWPGRPQLSALHAYNINTGKISVGVPLGEATPNMTLVAVRRNQARDG